jgi:hypothetical protein
MSETANSATGPSDGKVSSAVNLDALLTPAQFAQWLGESEYWVRRRLASLPGVIREGRKHVRIHPRTYLEKQSRISTTDGDGRR